MKAEKIKIWIFSFGSKNNSFIPSDCDKKLLDFLLYGNRWFDTKHNQNVSEYFNVHMYIYIHM